MAIIRKKDIKNMKQAEVDAKIKELRLELVRGSVTANRANAKTKEIKRTLARLLTFNKSKNSLKNA
jgi:ribosomal protein L29